MSKVFIFFLVALTAIYARADKVCGGSSNSLTSQVAYFNAENFKAGQRSFYPFAEVLNQHAADFKRCRDGFRSSAELAHVDINKINLIVAVKANENGSMEGTCPCSDILGESETIQEARIKTSISECYAKVISKLKVSNLPKGNAYSTMCWDGYPLKNHSATLKSREGSQGAR